MEDKKTLLQNIKKIHTTPAGVQRIKGNLRLDNEYVVNHVVDNIQTPECNVSRQGKNYYCRWRHEQYVINASSFTIITAHRL